MKPRSITHTDKGALNTWTVTGRYRDEGSPDGRVLEGDFVATIDSYTAGGAYYRAHEYERWLISESVLVMPRRGSRVPRVRYGVRGSRGGPIAVPF